MLKGKQKGLLLIQIDWGKFLQAKLSKFSFAHALYAGDVT